MPTPYTGSSTSSVPFTGDPLIDGLIIGEKWGGPLGTAFSVTYSFPDLNSTWSTDPVIGYDEPGSGWEPWDSEYRGLDATEQNAVRIAIQAWGAVANVNPVETAENANVVGDIRIAFTTGGTMDAGTYAYAYTPLSNTPYAGDVWLNPFPPEPPGNDFSTGAAGYSTIIHELGHAFGLDHPFSIPDFPKRFDNFKFTVMSYSDAPGHVDTGYSSFYPTTPMLLDIQAMQYLYGPNMTYHAGNDTYTFTQGVNYYQTIWDAGGIDTMRYNASTDGALIDLHAGKFSQLGNAILLSDGVTLQDDNVAIAYDVIIENAIGGDAGDEIIGNNVGNVLNGRAGADTMSGGAGNDTYVVDTVADVVTELTGRGADLVQSSTSYALPANVENLRLMGSGNLDATGNELANIIYANTGDNVLDGGAGADTLSYQFGATAGVAVSLTVATAQATGGSGSDTLSSIERLTGSNYGDALTGKNGNNVLRGLDGNDTLSGRGGDDVLAGGAGQDNFDFTAALNAATNVDRITDFNLADDLIRLDNDIFTAFATPDVALAEAFFHKGPGVTAAHDANDRIVYDTATGNLYYDADGIDGAAATLFATLTTHPAITAADFFITS